MQRFEVTLGGKGYSLRPFNIGELEEFSDINDKLRLTRPTTIGFATLYLALTRCAEPPVSEAEAKGIVASITEVNEAIAAVMIKSGMREAVEKAMAALKPAVESPDPLAR